MYRGTINLYGHEHGNILDYSNCCDVGVDKWNFFPITLEQILARIEKLVPWTAKVSYLPSNR